MADDGNIVFDAINCFVCQSFGVISEIISEPSLNVTVVTSKFCSKYIAT